MFRKSTTILAALAGLLFQFHAARASCVSKPAQEIVIVIDVGHVPPHPGRPCRGGLRSCGSGETSARGVKEYDFNLPLAKHIHEALVNAGFVSTHLFVPSVGTSLQQRTDYANGLNADIFISVHHDGVDDRFKKSWTYQGRQQHYFDDEKGFSLHISPRNVQYADSLHLARILADRLMAKGLQFTTIHDLDHREGAHVPYADAARGIYQRDHDVFVLHDARMPAVLIEGGSIVNRDEELQVSTPAFRSLIASSVVESIEAFCGPTAAALAAATPQSAGGAAPSVGSATQDTGGSARTAEPAYRVIGVATNDVLEMRAGPDANSAVVDTIASDGKDIRMTGTCSAKWCPVAYRNVRGWVDSRFLALE